jgi:hypothetical protein
MLEIKYGGFSFPSPLPFVGEDLNSIVLSGSLDHIANNISLVGEITGCDLNSVKTQKDQLVRALSSGYQRLVIGNTGYDFAKPVSINFPTNNVRKRLPYEISFECYENLNFSQFYGISDPVDVWTFTEDDDRIVRATHNVSARGLKLQTGSSLESAKNFVNNRLKGFDNNLSLFFSGQTPILTSKNEEINRVSNIYGITEEWSLSRSLNGFDKSDSIVRADCSISYDSESSLSLSVRGTIQGGISGSADTGYFTIQDATNFARNSVVRSKIPYEESLYGAVVRGPRTYSYTLDTGSNNISFSFEFVDPTNIRTGDVLHDYATSISTSKDDPFSSVSVNGSVYYASNRDIFSTTQPETEQRWKKVDSYFSGVNPFLIAQEHFNLFKDPSLAYNLNDLNDVISTYNVSKNPYGSIIEYDFSYSNRPDLFSGMFRDISLTIETTHPILAYSIEPTTDNSFAVQEAFSTIERKSVSLNASLNSGVNFNTALSYVNSWVLQYSGQGAILTENSLQTGSNTFSLTKSFAKP